MNLKKNGKAFTSKFVGTGPPGFLKKIIYQAAVSKRLRNTGVEYYAYENQYRLEKSSKLFREIKYIYSK